MQLFRFFRLYLLLFFLQGMYAWAQCPQPSFIIPDTVCINEPLAITNTTTNATRYEWDFCSGDLESEPVTDIATTIPSAFIPTDITNVFDGTNWYGFVSSRDNYKLFRLDFGSSLSNNPSITDLGNPGNLLARHEQLKIVKVGNDWVGLTVNSNNFVDNTSVTRLNFGNSLTNVPIADRIIALDAHVSVPRGIEIINDNGNFIALIANSKNNVVTIVNFGNSLLNNISNSNIINIALPSAASGLNLMGISVIRDCDQWYGMAASFNNKIYKLDFGSNLFSSPIITEITTTQSLMLSPVKVSLRKDMGKFYAFVMHINGRVIGLDFGQDLQSNTPSIINNFDVTADVVGMEVVKSASSYYLFTVDFINKTVIRFTFPDNCNANFSVTTSQSPSDVSYNSSGLRRIELTTFTNNTVKSVVTNVFVRPQVIADFTTTNKCVGSATNFTAVTPAVGNRITSYAWDFGNGNTASGRISSFTFPSNGAFPVKLTVTDVCGKVSQITKLISIVKINTANFSAPTSACSNEPIRFQDASLTYGDAIKTWAWNFDDGKTSNEQSPEHIFTTAGTFQVSLTITGESGCTETITKSITIAEGASVDFAVENACFGNTTVFRNLTTLASNTSEVSREWNFGDNTTSDQLNPTHTYATMGDYTVTLTVRNNLNCTTTKTKIITIRKKPEPAFSLSLACSGEPVSFFDESISTDGSIKTWTWEFDDPESGTNNISNVQQAPHVFAKAGTYQVKLTIETIYGCTESLIKNVTIVKSPQAGFTNQLNCNTKEVIFTDQSAFEPANPVSSWYWDFGDNTTSQAQHPAHTYRTKGNYIVTLVTTAASRCTNTFTRTITIPGEPVANFTFPEKICIDTPVQFTDVSAPDGEEIVSWQWDFAAFGNATVQHPQITFTGIEAAVVPVKLIVVTAAGCTATTTKNISLQKPAEGSFSYQPLSELNPLSIRFSGVAANAAAISWDFGDGKQSTEPNPQHTYETGGVYKVVFTVINAAGCTTLVQQDITVSNIPSVFELKLESLLISQTGNTAEVQIRLLNNSPHTLQELDLQLLINEQQNYTHVWQGNLLPGKMLNYAFTIPATYTVSADLYSICLTTISSKYTKASNRQCTAIENTFRVLNPYPNPADLQTMLPFLLPSGGDLQITITDLTGRNLAAYSYQGQAGFHQIQINKGTLQAGMYFIRYNFNGQQQIKPVIFK